VHAEDDWPGKHALDDAAGESRRVPLASARPSMGQLRRRGVCPALADLGREEATAAGGKDTPPAKRRAARAFFVAGRRA